MSTLYNKIRTRHTTGLTTQIKDFLPIIGNEIPNKLITYFSVEDDALITATSGGFDYIKAYHGKSCYKGVADTDTQTITYTPAVPLNLTTLSDAEVNNYATITRPATATDAKDKLHLVLQWRCKATASGDVPTFSIQVKNGTKTATLATAFTVTNIMENKWWKTIFAMNSTVFTYANGFADADWANVTDIVISHSVDANPCDFYVHGLWIALPYEQPGYGGDTITGAYYPRVPDSNVIYVSHLFGDDANTGLTKIIPKKTIEAGLAAAVSGGKDYVCIIDSATYKPIDTANNCAGLSATLTANVTIIADYLETPTISTEAGLFDATRTGARDYYRTAFYENIGGAGAKLTVGTGGTYATIALAYAAASAGDCIEIVDSAVYDETLDIAKDITIQAAPLCKPTWKYSGGNNTVTSTGDYAINIFGIIFEGNNSAAEQRIVITNTAATKKTNIVDCTVKDLGTTNNSAVVYGIYLRGTGRIENCLAFDIAKNANASFVAHVFYLLSENPIMFMNNEFKQDRIAAALRYLTASVTAGGITIKGCSISAPEWIYGSSNIGIYLETNTANASTWMYYNINYTNIESVASNATAIQYFSGNELIENKIVISLAGTRQFTENVINTCYILHYAAGIYSFGIYKRNIFYGNVNSPAYMPKMFWYMAYGGTPASSTELTFDNNLCVNYDLRIYTLNQTYNKNILYNLEIDVSNTTITMTDTLYYGVTIAAISPPQGVVNFTTSVNADPLLLNPSDGNFGWEVDSPIENITYDAYGWREFLPALIEFDGATYTGGFKFINFTGSANFNLIKSGTAISALQYCTIAGFCQGVRADGNKVSVLNCDISDIDGFAIMNYATDTALISTIKNNIITDCYVGVFLRSGADLQYNTIIDNDYGVYGYFFGFYSIEQYAKDYVTIMNNILFNNTISDYDYDKLSDYNIIGTRAFPLSAGDNDITENPQLDDNNYPATVYTGFKRNSPAYLGASDTGKHIGARNEQHIKAVLAYTAYTLVDNPINFTQELEPINAQTTMSVTGEYEGIVDAFVAAFNLEWTEDTITDATQKLAIEAIKKTTWILGLSFDAGVTYNYYKVELDGVLSTKQPVYVLQEVPYGSYSIRVREIPGFDITNYEVDAL